MISSWINRLVPPFICLFLLLPFFSDAQVTGIITNSKTGKPISGVEVFINKTAIATQSDEAGQFTLENVLPGFQELILFKKGYVLYRSPMRIQAERLYNLKLSLASSEKSKSSRLAVKEQMYMKNQLLETARGDSIVFFNIEDGSTPLIIRNNSTGYQLSYYLMGQSLETISDAALRFEFLPSTGIKQSILWEENRKNEFNGSVRHWLRATIADQLDKEGYLIKDANGNDVNAQSFLTQSTLPGYTKLNIDKIVFVTYKDQNGITKTSQVKTNGAVDVNGKGQMINPKALSLQGDMAKTELANQFPMDYEPIVGEVEDTYAKTIERFYEKIYVHTDKPYYYPGEPMWFKGYIHYKESLWRDSLSRVVYVDLINSKNEIALAKNLKIDSGFFHNDFILPDTLKEGTYWLRAYTNLNRNFGDSNIFVKEIPILKTTDKVVRTQGKIRPESDTYLAITSDKQNYKSRDKITLYLKILDSSGKTLASNLSISVTDAIHVVPIEEPVNMMTVYPFKKNEPNKVLELNHPVEYGVSFRGKFLNDRGKPEKTTLNIMQLKPRNMMWAVTDAQGFFSQSGLDFYDTTTFLFKSEKAKNFPYGKVVVLPRELPMMNFKTSDHTIELEHTQSPQHIVSEYEVPKGAIMLQEVVVKSTKIKDERSFKSYGYADFIIAAKDINQTNILYTLAHYPGVFVDMMSNRIVFTRSATQSIYFGEGPLVTIDDIPMGGSDAGTILSSLNPASIESIAITKRYVPIYGSLGGNGIISIYMKHGVTEDQVTPNFELRTIQGYFPGRPFRYPDYNDPLTDMTVGDYRSTIYWNPEVETDQKKGVASVSFFAADLPGEYRIVAEGVLGNGEPVRCVYFINVE